MTTKFLSTLGLILLVHLSCFSQFAETEYLTPLFPDITLSYAFDADGDADADVVMASSSVQEIGVVSQTSPGIHHGLVRIPCSNFPITDFADGDFNGDGVKEVVIYSDTLKQFTCIANPYAVAMEIPIADSLDAMVHWQFFDYNNDGKTDFIYSTTESIFISYAQDDWQFAAPVVLLDPPNAFFSFIVGDTDTDTDYDITIGETNQFRVYVRNSQGVYNPGTPLVTTGNPVRLFLKNVFGTNHPEVFYVTTAFFWSLNNTSNTFQGNNLLASNVLNGECSLMPADMDSDSDVDLMLSYRINENGGVVKYFTNTNSGFTSGTWDFAQSYGGKMQMLDMNGDGILDYHNQNPYPGLTTKYFYYLRGSSTFAISENIARNPVFPHHVIMESGYPTASALQFGDIDGDGDQDMVVASQFKLMWYPNDGSGHFTEAPHLIWQLGSVNSGTKISLRDYDLDGDLDVAYWNGAFANDGNGHFTSTTFTYPPGTWPCDINADGITDYISVTNTQFKTYYGLADGTFSPAYVYNHSYGTLTIHSAFSGDFDGDGVKKEVFFNAQSAGNELAIRFKLTSYPNNFYANTMSSCFGSRAFIVGDFDGDNDSDFKCTYNSTWTKTGSINPPPFDVNTEEYDFLYNYPGERSYYTDVDHDGNFDYFCAQGTSTLSNSVVWIELDLTTMDQTHQVFNENEVDSRFYAFHDLDQDGDDEMIFTCKNGSVGIKENLFNNNFTHSLFIKSFVDVNENGTWENDEPTADGVPVQIGVNGNDIYSMVGDYIEIPRAAGAYTAYLGSLNNSPYESLGVLELSGILGSSNLHDTLYFPVRALGAEIELVSSAAVNACAYSATVNVGVSNGNTEVINYTGHLSWTSVLTPGDWSNTPFVIENQSAEWSFGSIEAFADTIHSLSFSWPTDAPSDSLIVRWTLFDEAGGEIYHVLINLNAECDPQATFDVLSLNGMGDQYFIGPNDGVTYQYTFDAIAGSPSDVVLQLELSDALVQDAMSVWSSNYPVTIAQNTSQGLLISVNDYFNATANADSAWYLTLHFPLDTTSFNGGIVDHIAHVFLNSNNALSDTTFHTLYDCSTILSLNTIPENLCIGSEIEVLDQSNDNETYQWIINGDIIAAQQEAIVTLNGDFNSIIVQTSNDFCSASDTLSWNFFPQMPIALSFTAMDSILTATGAFSGYVWNLNGDSILTTSENYIHLTLEGMYIVEGTDTNGCVSFSDALNVVLVCDAGDLNCDGAVNISDIQLLIENIGCVGTCDQFDLDENGIITVDDLMILLNLYNP